MADKLEGAASKRAAVAAINRWAKSNVAFERLGDAVYVPTVLAWMAGQLMVRGREAKQVQLAGPDGAGDSGGGPEVTAFLDLPWEDALQEFRNRGIVKPTELSRLLKDYGQRSAEVRRLMLENVQLKIRDELETAIADGTTFREFANTLRENEDQLGITTEDPAYLQMVFRTNVQSAYGAGRYRAMKDPDVMEARPYAEYRTVGDARVGDDHRPMHGKIFRIGSPEYERASPPNRPNCRCSWVSLSPDELNGRRVEDELPSDFVIDPDFDGPPVAKL